MAAKFFVGLPLDGPDPECVNGHGADVLGAVSGTTPRPAADHSRAPMTFTRKPVLTAEWARSGRAP